MSEAHKRGFWSERSSPSLIHRVCAHICRWSILVYAPARGMDGLVHNRSVHSSSTSPLLCATLSLSLALSFSNSSAHSQSGVCCQPSYIAMKSEPCVLFHTLAPHALFCRKKRRTSFTAAVPYSARGCTRAGS